MKPPKKKPFPNCNTVVTREALHLPEPLDRLLDERWTPENSRKVDNWLWYVELEFGGRVAR